jgi:hypothetical protein
MGLHEFAPVGGRAAGGRDGRRLQRLAEVCENLTSRGRSHPGLLPLANLRFEVSRLLPGEPLEREGGPGARAQQVFETLKIARHVAVDKRDPDAGVDGKPAVLPGEHVGGGPLYEPLINSKVAAEVPLAGLSFIDRATLYPSERMAICPSTNW